VLCEAASPCGEIESPAGALRHALRRQHRLLPETLRGAA
jgi:hypothetical protein